MSRVLPGVKPYGQWSGPNQSCYNVFMAWLREGGYSASALKLYGLGARFVLGYLDQPYWQLDLEADIERARAYLTELYPSLATRQVYDRGIGKLVQYLQHRGHRPEPQPELNWAYYLAGLPDWLAQDVRAYVAHCRRSWPTELQPERTGDLLSHETQSLRWLAAHASLPDLGELTPQLWYQYVDSRLAAGIQPVTLNGELSALRALLTFLAEQPDPARKGGPGGQPVCTRMLKVEYLAQGTRLPRDLPPEQLRQLLNAIEQEAASSHGLVRHLGILDRAWFHLMLHSGLRVGEVRRVRSPDLDLARRYVRIEQSKGLKDRMVPLSPATVSALQSYLPLRGPAESDHVFTYRHRPLSQSYCYERLQTYGERCGVRATPHQLRHSCATLLLNTGASILTVQAVLGHKQIDITLEYARLYDGTVAADYYRAMAQVERDFQIDDLPVPVSLGSGQLLALVDHWPAVPSTTTSVARCRHCGRPCWPSVSRRSRPRRSSCRRARYRQRFDNLSEAG